MIPALFFPSPILSQTMSNPYRKTDHISYRKPGANRIEEGVLVIPALQVWDGYFSFRSASGDILRDVPIDATEWSSYEMSALGTAIGLNTRRSWNPGEIRAHLQSHIHFEGSPPEVAPPPETEAERQARTARETAKETRKNTLRTAITTHLAELEDIEEALFVVKPSVVKFLRQAKTTLLESMEIYTRELMVLNA